MLRKLAPALVVPLLVVASCATEAGDATVEVRTGPAAAATLRAAPDAAAEAGTASFRMVMELSVQGIPLTVEATGAFDTDNQRMSMEMDMGAMLDEIASSTGETVPEGFDEPMRFVADGSTMYVQSPLFDVAGGPGGWLSISSEDLGSGSAGLGSYDPSTFLESLRGVKGGPEVVGTEEIDGVETTHYTATLDLRQAVEEAPDDQRALIEAQLGQLGAAEIAVDAWIDGDGLPRRLRMDMGSMFGALGLGAGTDAVMTMDFFDYGVPVDIRVPSPDEVTPFTDVMGTLGGMAGDGA